MKIKETKFTKWHNTIYSSSNLLKLTQNLKNVSDILILTLYFKYMSLRTYWLSIVVLSGSTITLHMGDIYNFSNFNLQYFTYFYIWLFGKCTYFDRRFFLYTYTSWDTICGLNFKKSYLSIYENSLSDGEWDGEFFNSSILQAVFLYFFL